MARFFGKVGYAIAVETAPGVYSEQITERDYYGDEQRVQRRLENSGNLNDNVTTSTTISIVADGFAYENIFAIRYVEWAGAKWKVTIVDIKRPRLILNLGGVYNAQSS